MQISLFLLIATLCASSPIKAASQSPNNDEVKFSHEMRTSALQVLQLLTQHQIAQGNEGLQFTPGTPPLISGKFSDTSKFKASDDTLWIHQPRTVEQIIAAFDAGRAIIKDDRENPEKYQDVGTVYLRTFFTTLGYTVNTPDAQPTTHRPTAAAGAAAATHTSSTHAPHQTATAARQSVAPTPEELLRAGMRKFCGNSETQRAASSAPAKKETASEKQLRVGMQKLFGGPSSKQ